MAPPSTAKKQHESAVFLNAVDPTGLVPQLLTSFVVQSTTHLVSTAGRGSLLLVPRNMLRRSSPEARQEIVALRSQ